MADNIPITSGTPVSGSLAQWGSAFLAAIVLAGTVALFWNRSQNRIENLEKEVIELKIQVKLITVSKSEQKQVDINMAKIEWLTETIFGDQRHKFKLDSVNVK